MQLLTISAGLLFFITYILMFAFQKIRPHVALISAFLFVLAGSLSLFPTYRYTVKDALLTVDWNVLMMIAGTMGTVYLFIESRMPERMSEILVSRIHTARYIIVVLSLFAGFISAFVDNVATVLMVAPVALAICKEIETSPVPAIICIAISSNLQGAATLVGDTTSILLGKAAHLDFMDFFFLQGKAGMFWVTEAGALLSALILLFLLRKEKKAVFINTKTKVEDKVPALLLLLTIGTLIGASFIPYRDMAQPGGLYKPEVTNGLICLLYFAVGIIRACRKARSPRPLKEALRSIDYYTLSLLAGLFIIIGGITRAGLIDRIGVFLAGIGGDGSQRSVFLIYSLIVWGSVLCSAFIDNIPYTATMLPVVEVVSHTLSQAGGLTISPYLFFFGLLVGATLGGNITPIGASANITGIGLLRKEGYTVPASSFMKYSVPFTLTAVTTGYLLVWALWF